MGKSKKKTPMKLRMFLNGELTEGTEVFRQSGGKKYTVHTDVIDILFVQADVIDIYCLYRLMSLIYIYCLYRLFVGS